MGTIVILPNVRLAHPHLFKAADPMAGSNSGPKYDSTGIFAPDSEAGKLAQNAFITEAQKTFGANFQAIVGAMDKGKKCLRQGNTKLTKEGKISTGFENMLYIVAKNAKKPIVIADRFFQGKPIELDEAGNAYQNGTRIDPGFKPVVPYGGCYVNLKVEVYGMNKPGIQGIYATLMAVQYHAQGESFGGSAAPSADGFEEGEYDEADAGADMGFGAANTANPFAQQPAPPWDAAPAAAKSLF